MRRGLSPLVATIVLIAFTVLGGVLVYEFFIKTSESLISSGETLIATATKSYYDNKTLLVTLDIVNGYRADVKIAGFNYITSTSSQTGTPTIIYGGGNVNLLPGAKHSAVILVPNDTKAIMIRYSVKGQELVKTVTLG